MITSLYYTIKPLIPRRMQIAMRRFRVRRQLQKNQDYWPILGSAGTAPPEWPGWPGGKQFAIVLTHDVELDFGVSRCEQLANMEQERGFRSAFAFVPKRYQTPERLRCDLAGRGFEIMVHDYNHDGKLYRNRHIFEARRPAINSYLEKWKSVGFASGAALHNLSWISELNIDYDISTFDVDPFEPQDCGLGQIFPYWVQPPHDNSRGFVELPYTIPQDFTVFILLRQDNIDIWRRKIDWIAEMGGMVLVKTHPDYMAFSRSDRRIDRYPVERYLELLEFIRTEYGGQAWLARPSEVAQYWRGLQPLNPSQQNSLPAQDMFCSTCRKAHASGWLSHYRPQSVVTERA